MVSSLEQSRERCHQSPWHAQPSVWKLEVGFFFISTRDFFFVLLQILAPALSPSCISEHGQTAVLKCFLQVCEPWRSICCVNGVLFIANPPFCLTNETLRGAVLIVLMWGKLKSVISGYTLATNSAWWRFRLIQLSKWKEPDAAIV